MFSASSQATIMKVFLAQFVNTALIVLVVNAKLPNDKKSIFFVGDYDDFTPQVGFTQLSINLYLKSLFIYLFFKST